MIGWRGALIDLSATRQRYARWKADRLQLMLLCVPFIAFYLLVPENAGAAVKIQEVRSSKGVTAWLVEDYAEPLIAIRFAFDGGSAQEPVGQEGMANLLSSLFDEGAGDLESDAFQKKLDDVGAEMSFSASRDTISGGMRMLAETKDDALPLLRSAINAPRFDAPAISRMRNQLVADLESKSRDPNYLAQDKWLEALYGQHSYGRQDDGTRKTLSSITQADLQKFHRRLFARENLHVAVVGAINAETLKTEIDRLFGDLPEKPELTPVAEVKPKLGQDVTYVFDQAETSIVLTYPGLKREDPAYLSAYLLNEVLGGSAFTSRLFFEVREKRGLTYGVNSGLANYDHSEGFAISTSTRPEKAAEALSVIKSVVAGLAADGPTQAEIDAAKKNVIGSYAINNLNSSGAIAATLLGIQMNNLGIDYIDRRAALINAVTLDEVKAVAKRLLTTTPAILIVGSDADKLDKAVQ